MRSEIPRPILTIRMIAAAIGLDPDSHRIRSIDIHADVREMATVAVTMPMDVDGTGKLTEVIRRYRLEEQAQEQDVACVTRIAPETPGTITDEDGTHFVNFRKYT